MSAESKRKSRESAQQIKRALRAVLPGILKILEPHEVADERMLESTDPWLINQVRDYTRTTLGMRPYDGQGGGPVAIGQSANAHGDNSIAIGHEVLGSPYTIRVDMAWMRAKIKELS